MIEHEAHGLSGQQEHGRFADFLHQSLNHNIALADRKSSIVFTLATAVIVFALQHDEAAIRGQLGLLTQAAWSGVLLALLVSAASAAHYAGAVAEQPPAALDAAKFEHCYALARICDAKYRLLQLAMIMAAVGLGGFVAASAVAAFAQGTHLIRLAVA